MSRFRITIRGENPAVELRGYIDSPEAVFGISEVIKPWGVVIASQAAEDYTPFGPSAPTKIVTLPGDNPDANSRPPLDEDWAIGGSGGWGTRGQEGDG